MASQQDNLIFLRIRVHALKIPGINTKISHLTKLKLKQHRTDYINYTFLTKYNKASYGRIANSYL